MDRIWPENRSSGQLALNNTKKEEQQVYRKDPDTYDLEHCCE